MRLIEVADLAAALHPLRDDPVVIRRLRGV
jgi:hypothetical protein